MTNTYIYMNYSSDGSQADNHMKLFPSIYNLPAHKSSGDTYELPIYQLSLSAHPL